MPNVRSLRSRSKHDTISQFNFCLFKFSDGFCCFCCYFDIEIEFFLANFSFFSLFKLYAYLLCVCVRQHSFYFVVCCCCCLLVSFRLLFFVSQFMFNFGKVKLFASTTFENVQHIQTGGFKMSGCIIRFGNEYLRIGALVGGHNIIGN